MKSKILGLPKNVFYLGLTSLLNDFSSEMILAIFPAFFISVLKAGAASLGLVEGVAEAASNIIKIYSGRWSDKIQRRKIFAGVGYAVSVCSRPFYLLVKSIGGVIGIRVTDRIGKGLRDSPRDALISLSTPAEEIGRSFGYHRAMDTIGAILGPLVAYLILSRYPLRFNTVFITAFIVGLAAILSLVLIKDVAGIVKSKRDLEKPESLPLKFKFYVASIFVLSIGSLPITLLLFKTRDIGISIASIPLFYMIYNLSYAAFSWPAGRIADSIGTSKVIFTGYVFLILCYLVLNISSTSVIMVVAFLSAGIFSGLTDGVQRSHVSQLISDKYKGLAYGYLNAAVGFGALVAGVLGGFLWQHVGDGFALMSAAAVVIVGLAIFGMGQVAG